MASRTGTNAFVDILSATTTFTPSGVSTTDFRRRVISTFNGKQCNWLVMHNIAVNPVPVASLTGSNTSCDGRQVNYRNRWNANEFFRNGTSLGPISVQIPFRVPTLLPDSITVEVTNSNSCTTLSSPIVMTLQCQQRYFNFAGNILCEGSLPAFTASPAVGHILSVLYQQYPKRLE